MRVSLDGSVLLRLVGLPVRLPVNVAAKLWTWGHNARSRQVLRNLPPYLMDDVGLTRAQAEAESLKRFWMK